MLKICFVCHGNICRSPMAEFIFKKILEEKGKLKTTKKEKEGHGIGLNSIKEVVERYDGILQLDYKGNLFVAFVVLFC